MEKAIKTILVAALLTAVVVLAGTFTELVQRYMNWTTRSKGAVILRRICGVLVLAGGFYMICVAG